MEKRVFTFILLGLLLLQVVQIAAATPQIEVTKEPVQHVVVTELSKNAQFNLIIKNLGGKDSFEVYTLVGNVELKPEGFITIDKDETKVIPLEVQLDEKVRKNYGDYGFKFNIRGQSSGIIEESLKVTLARFKESLKVSTEDITLESQNALLVIENVENYTFENLTIDATSTLFSHSEQVTLKPYEKIEIKIPLNQQQIRGLVAGEYITTVKLSEENAQEIYESHIRFLERTGTATSDEGAGFFVISRVIEKRNEGNVVSPVEITVKKDILSRLFTSFSATPDTIERKGFIVTYTWRKELNPGETLRIVVNTNWIIPLAIFLAVLIAAIVIKVVLTRDLKVQKEIVFVKTKGGEFALKVLLKVRATRFVEKIVVIDRLPPLVKLFERFGAVPPQKVDEKSRRLEWQMENMQAGEERIFSYLIYSKIAIVGKYELPTAMAVYERDGKIHESQSNKVFFLAEQVPMKKEEI